MDFFIQTADAQSLMGSGSDLMGLAPLVLIFVVFYFLLIRPQTKRQKEHREMVSAIAEGNEVVTAGGVLGKVIKATEQFVTIEIADGVEIAVQKHTVGAVMPKGTMKSARSGKPAPKEIGQDKPETK